MPRTYVLTGNALTLANAAVTLAFINPGASQSIEVLRAWASQSGSTTSAQQRVNLVTQVTGFPTLVSATPARLNLSDPVSVIIGGTAGAAGTCGVNASAEGAGAKTTLLADAFNVLSGWLWVPTPEERIVLNAGATSGFGLHFPAAPTSLTGWSFGLVFREL